MTIRILAGAAAAFLFGALTFAGCSNDDTVVDNNASTDAGSDDGGTDAGGCVEVDACVTCPAFLAALDAGQDLPICKCDGKTGSSSADLFAAIQQCTCQASCATECLSVCADGPANDTCNTCASTKCAAQYSACYATPITTMHPDAGMTTNDASTVDDGGDGGDVDAASMIDAGHTPTDSGSDSGSDAGDSGIRDAGADG